MGIKVSINGGGKDFEPVSEGIHTVALVDIIDLGEVQTSFGIKPKVLFVYISDEMDEGGEPRQIRERFTPSVHEKSSLRPRAEQLLNRKLTAEEEQDFDLDVLVGCQKQFFVEHNEGTSNGKTKIYANLGSAVKGTVKQPIGIPESFVRDQDKPAAERLAVKRAAKGSVARTASGPAAVKQAGGGTAVAKAVLAPPAPTPIINEDIPF